MNIESYYDKAYFGLHESFPPMISPIILSHYLQGSILDVGCGQGRMVKEMSAKGFKVFGCDIFDSVADLGENFFFHDMVKRPTKQKFQSIYSIHVLEHVFDYISFLRHIRESLKEDGVFFLAVPNAYSLLSRVKFFLGDETITMGVGEVKCVENNKLEPHVRWFGKKSLETILELNGLNVIECFGTNAKGERHWLKTLGGSLNFVCKKIELKRGEKKLV